MATVEMEKEWSLREPLIRLARDVKKAAASLKAKEARRRMALIQPTLDYSGFRQLDVVFEAVVEKLRITSYNVCYTKLLRNCDTVWYHYRVITYS